MTSIAEILKLSGLDPNTCGVDTKSLYSPIHAGADGKVYKGKDAVRQAQAPSDSDKTGIAPSYKLKMVTDCEHWLALFITQDAEMQKLKDSVRKIVDLTYPVLIRGETGTGKELIAKALHGKRIGDFIDVNCGGFPEHLIESELFGHVKGAFTGADAPKQGLFQAAAGGTLFLDEIGELPMLMQCKLLRALQEKVVRKVGSNYNEAISCRIVAASHCDLGRYVIEKKFREDLLWRLNTFELDTKPIRARRADIPLISKAFGVEIAADDITGPIYGNVREIQRFLLRRKYMGM
tara:strand:+ start:3112 stop:3987 length:876 start_codon:yes stop_codon:yes gene_type:complete